MDEITERWEIAETEERQEDEQDVVTYQIAYYPADYTLRGYLDKWKSGQLYVPRFQRNYVWDQVQASKLIESFLLGLPVPGVFIYKERKTNRLQIIDGQQRIQTAVRYFQNDFDKKVFKLKNVLPKWDGKRYQDLDEVDRFQLDDAVLRATVVQQLDPDDDSSIYQIFERLNSGGMKLSSMEIRKCVYLSQFYTLLEEINTLESWRKLIGKQQLDKRLRDVEFILRILALREYIDKYEKPMKKFLNDYMSEKRNLEGEALKRFLKLTRTEFTKTCNYVFEQLGEKAFHLRGRLNYAVMDSTMSIAFSALQNGISDLSKRFEKLKRDKTYFEHVTINTSDEKSVKKRFALAVEYLTS